MRNLFDKEQSTSRLGVDWSRQESHFNGWIQRRTLPLLSTNHGAEQVAFQDWRPVKESFAPELIERAVSETTTDLGRSIEGCVDPFGGSGTTALACQFLGIPCETIEVNPFLADLIEAKLRPYRVETLEAEFQKVCRRVRHLESTIAEPFPGAPETFVQPGVDGKFLFWRDVAIRIAAYREAICGLRNARSREFFLVMLGCIVVSLSNAVVSGKGRRYRKSWQARKVQVGQVDKEFFNACAKAIINVHPGRDNTGR